MKKDYRKAMILGAIAGSLGGLTASVMVYVYLLSGILSMRAHYFEVPVFSALIVFILLTAFYGSLWALLYSMFYDSIPGKGITKGLIFGLLIYLIKDVQAGTYLAFASSLQVELLNMAALDLMTIGIYSWIVWGLILGYLYKK